MSLSFSTPEGWWFAVVVDVVVVVAVAVAVAARLSLPRTFAGPPVRDVLALALALALELELALVLALALLLALVLIDGPGLTALAGDDGTALPCPWPPFNIDNKLEEAVAAIAGEAVGLGSETIAKIKSIARL